MKLKIALLSTMLFCGYASMGQKPDARTILLKSAEILKQKELFQYEAQYRIKYFDNSDTTPLSTYKCVLLKAPADTVLNHYARVYNQDEDKIYDGYNFLLIWHGQKKILKDNPLVSGKNFTRNNIKRDFLPNFLYSPTPFKGYLADATEMKVSATLLNGVKAWKIDISLPTDEEITLLKRVVYINQRNYYPMKVEGFAKFQNIQDEYYSLVINNLICSDSAEDDFTKYYQYPENYAEESFKAPKINYDLLPPGTAFIPVDGLSLDGKEQNLNEEFSKDKLILLDFWYLACANCLRAMPHLSSLASTYKDRGLLVYGLNPYDDPNTKREVAKKFIDKFKVEYPQVFINKSLAEQYQIKIYPSMYLIKNGKVVYAHIGYSETQIKELEQVIQKQLSK